MRHEKRKFFETVDYLTSPGWLDGPGAREKAGLPGNGPTTVITNMAIMGFDADTKQMYLREHYPGTNPETILDHMEFKVDIARSKPAKPPSESELEILRDTCDPQRLILEN